MTDAWRPPQWGGYPQDQAQLIYLRTSISEQGSYGYFFDAVIKEEHVSTLKITEHPVQTGANIADHAYLMPGRITMEIGMSDVMDTLVQGQFSDYKSKSVSAYQTLKRLQADRSRLQIVTRLNTYQDMLLEVLSAPDSHETLYGLKATAVFKEVITVSVSVMRVSKRSQAAGKTSKGKVQLQPVTGDPSLLLLDDLKNGGMLKRSRQGTT